MNEQKRMFMIKFAYWFGIAADAAWAVALLFPPVFASITGRPDFDPDLQVRLIMAIGGILLTGWTVLLLWAVREPVGRRAVILITAFPGVFGMFVIALTGYLNGYGANLWILFKSAALFISMIFSFILAGRVGESKDEKH